MTVGLSHNDLLAGATLKAPDLKAYYINKRDMVSAGMDAVDIENTLTSYIKEQREIYEHFNN